MNLTDFEYHENKKRKAKYAICLISTISILDSILKHLFFKNFITIY